MATQTQKTTAYAETCGAKGDPTGRQRFYQIHYGTPSPTGWTGPFRDETDATNAAEDEAKAGNLELIWR